MRLLVALLFVLWSSGAAHAQGYQCRTSPVGASTAYCSSEAFVTQNFPVANSNLAQMPADTVKCNPTGSTANAQDCTSPVLSGSITSTVNLTGTSPLGSFIASSPNVSYFWQVTGQPLDQKNWDAAASGSVLQFRAVNDANTVGNPWMNVTRGTGATVASVSIPNLTVGGCTSILAFGGVGNNSTDNTTPLNNAFAALTGTGGCIFFPPGKYKFNSAISDTLPAGIFSVSLRGGGQDNTILTWPAASGGITFNYAGINSSVHVQDVSFTTGTTNGGAALTLNLSTSVANPAGTAVSDITRVTFRGDDGIELTDSWTTGINIANVSNVNFDGLAFFGPSAPGGVGVSLVGLPGSSTYGVVYNFAKCTFNLLADGIVYGSFIQGVTVNQSNFTGNAVGIVANIITGAPDQLAVSNSQFGGNVTAAIALNTAILNVQLINNLFIASVSSSNLVALTPNDHFVITGNNFLGTVPTVGGIIIGATTANTKGIITGNDISNLTTGVSLQAASANIAVVSNTFENNTTNIANSGTGNTITPNY